MANPYAEPMMQPGNPDQDQPCRAYAAPAGESKEPVEHVMEQIVSWADPHPIALVCSCGRRYQVTAA